jgi:hypothetical protein
MPIHHSITTPSFSFLEETMGMSITTIVWAKAQSPMTAVPQFISTHQIFCHISFCKDHFQLKLTHFLKVATYVLSIQMELKETTGLPWSHLRKSWPNWGPCEHLVGLELASPQTPSWDLLPISFLTTRKASQSYSYSWHLCHSTEIGF